LKQQHLPLQNITIVKNDKPISPRPKWISGSMVNEGP
jgi:hypothetical protein